MTSPDAPRGPAAGPRQNSQAGQVTYSGDMEEQYRAEYERAKAEGGFIGDIFAYMKFRAETAAYEQKTRESLESQVENYRPPAHSQCMNYLSYNHDDLKKMVTENMDPSSADEQGRAWTSIGNTLANLQTGLQDATNKSKDAWQGQAAEAARGYFTSVSAWSGNAAQGAQLTGERLSTQQEAASTAQSAMPEPIHYDTKDAMKDFFSAPPWDWGNKIDEIQEKFEEKQAKHEEAAQVMSTMGSSFQQSGSTMPAFAPPPEMQDSGGGTPPTPPQPPVYPPGTNPPNPPGSNPPGTFTPSGVGPGGTTTPSQVGPGGPGGPNIPGTPGGPGGPNIPGTPPIGFPPGTPPGGPGRPGPGRPGIPGPGRPGGPGGPPGGGRGGGPGGPGGGGRGGMPGGPGGGLGGAAAAGKGFGPGGSSGVLGGQGGAGGFGPSGGGAAGRAGAAGMGGMGAGAGAGKGQGDEDKEHKAASYLVETEDVFGDGTMVAPPVIGG